MPKRWKPKEANMKRLYGFAIPFAVALGLAGSVMAQTEQEGLVNINVEGVQIAVPIAVAAQVCNVNVGVIQEATADGSTFECEQGDLNDPVLQQYRT
jgi:mannose/fructose/N-acetylgalactosamine-specific phosphotransferase system component IIC